MTTREDRYRWPLLECIQDVHMAACGSSDPLRDLQERLDWLKMRLSYWMPGPTDTVDYDGIVRQLLVTVLLDVNGVVE